MIRTDEKVNRTIEVANPHLGSASVEIECTLFGDLGGGVGGRKYLDADFGRTSEDDRILRIFGPVRVEPSDVDRLYTVSCGHRAFWQGLSIGQKLMQETDNAPLAARMLEGWRRTHEDMTVPIGLDPVRELGKRGICQDLGPTAEIKRGLRIQIRKLDSDRHRRKYPKKAKNA